QRGPSKDEIIKVYQSLTQQSGIAKSRTPSKPQFLTAMPGAPDGEYVLFVYNSRFERWQTVAEQLVLTLEKDGQWRAVGYSRLLVNSPVPGPQGAYPNVPAYVGPSRARFVIPVEDKKVWSWYL